MLAALPESLDLLHLARQSRVLQGELALSGLSRLREALYAAPTGNAWVELRFGRDEQERLRVDGRVRAEVILQCQRCLSALNWPIDTEVHLAIVRPGWPDSELPSDCEPLEVQETPTSLKELVEDELLLALPLIPRHERCPQPLYQDNTPPAETEKAAVNPFQVLAQLKKTGDKP